jgi:catechol 2,3-dioxygenase-like lactoylglutathione lyase family enzyme
MMSRFDRITRRDMLVALPALAMTPRAIVRAAQGADPPVPVRRLHSFGLKVSDVGRSLDFYQGLFGAPVQARQGDTLCLRIGRGPQFFSIGPTGPGEPPRITHLCFTTESFDVDRILASLSAQGIATIDAPSTAPGLDQAMKAWVRRRGPEAGGAPGGTPELYFADPDGLIVQLQDSTYCGGGGPLGNVCESVEPASTSGLLAVRDLSHFTVFGSDGQRANRFFQDLFGLSVQAYQGPTAPVLGVGDRIQFVMFAGGFGGRGRGRRGGGPPAPPAPATIHHACLSMDGFDADEILETLTGYGIMPRGDGNPTGPRMHYISLRMPNRGGASGGTPELYFTDPDGLLLQLQDSSYCGGGGLLGNEC